MRFAFTAGTVLALSIAIGVQAQAPPRYNVVELRPFSLEGYFQAAAINNLGQVTGGITNPAGNRPIVFRSGADAPFEDSDILDRRTLSPPYDFPIFSDGMSIND